VPVVNMIRPLDFSGYPSIPETTKLALRGYVERRLPPGDFLEAVLTNNLFDAVFYASPENLASLRDLLLFINNRLPSDCCGNETSVFRWLEGSFG